MTVAENIGFGMKLAKAPKHEIEKKVHEVAQILQLEEQVEAMTLAHQIVVLRKGRIMQVGAPMELYRNPDNLFVAGFIGSPRINLVPVEQKGNMAVFPDGTSVVFSHDRPAANMGVRPEHFEVFSEPGQGTWKASIAAVERMGRKRICMSTEARTAG